MIKIDLLNGQGIPAKSRPEGIIATAITIIVPFVIALIMLGIYMSNRVVIKIQERETAGYEKKIEALSGEMRSYKEYQRQRGLVKQRITETAQAIESHEQWSDILITVVENIPDSLVLTKMSAEQRFIKVEISGSGESKKNIKKTIPVRTLYLTLGGAAGDVSDRQVQEFRDKLRFSKILGSKLEDIPVAQKVEMVDGREVITYEMQCIFRPQI
ncbi:MAG: hypothetical protein WC374_03950 [Phycisphaerae bacterium]|jgi:Tfp pilus assembly protein PilN